MARFPKGYEWLGNQGTLPRVIENALQLVGVQEIVGKGSNKTIIAWRDYCNQNGVPISGYSDDDIPWCGLFVAYICVLSGKGAVKDPLWARNWAKYGTPVAERRGAQLVLLGGNVPSLGDIMVYERPGGGGHVEFYIAESKTNYIGLGGNKSNRVMIGPIAKARCIAVRRPPFKNALPASVQPYLITGSGGPLTTNEH
jgi:uncharacterized protein (TIGR02594 family)